MHTKHFHIYYIQYVYCMWVYTCVNVDALRVGKPSHIWEQLKTSKGFHTGLVEIDPTIFL